MKRLKISLLFSIFLFTFSCSEDSNIENSENNENTEIEIIRPVSDGDLLWENIVSNQGNNSNHNFLNKIIICNDGNYAICGSHYIGNNQFINGTFIAKVSSSGNLVWDRIIQNTDSNSELQYGKGVAIYEENQQLIIGGQENKRPSFIRLDSQGNVLNHIRISSTFREGVVYDIYDMIPNDNGLYAYIGVARMNANFSETSYAGHDNSAFFILFEPESSSYPYSFIHNDETFLQNGGSGIRAIVKDNENDFLTVGFLEDQQIVDAELILSSFKISAVHGFCNVLNNCINYYSSNSTIPYSFANSIKKTNTGNFIISGSSRYSTYDEVSESLSGGYVLEVDNLGVIQTTIEIRDFKNKEVHDAIKATNGNYIAVGSKEWGNIGGGWFAEIDANGNYIRVLLFENLNIIKSIVETTDGYVVIGQAMSNEAWIGKIKL